MLTSSRKAKGRKLQDQVTADFRKLGEHYGLVDDDIKPTPMAQPGVDVQFSPAAKKIFDIDIECKNQERHTIIFDEFIKHFRKYHWTYDKTNQAYTRTWNGNTALKVLVYDKNYLKEGPLVIMRYEDFMAMINKVLPAPLLNKPFTVPKGQKDEETA